VSNKKRGTVQFFV